MRITQRLIPFLLLFCLSHSLLTQAQMVKKTPEPADARAVITDYINAIGGMDAAKKVNSKRDTGSFSVQGMEMPVVQKSMVPNKMLQVVNMNGMTVAKTVFDGTKGYSEQMGNHVDLGETEVADMKIRTSVIPQVDYLTNSAFKLSLLETENVGDTGAYKIGITMPSGTVTTEYYDKTSHLLIKQELAKDVSGQKVNVTYSFDDYRKAGGVLMPYKESLSIASGAINQTIDIILTDVKINEGVSSADFE